MDSSILYQKRTTDDSELEIEVLLDYEGNFKAKRDCLTDADLE